MKFLLTILIPLFTVIHLSAQNTNTKDELPYYEVPANYDEYTAGTVAARMIDGLGFRYRWATEELREEDLNYKPSEDARSCGETIDHILGLSRVIVSATLKIPRDFTQEQPELTYDQKRKETLENFQKASEILQKTDELDEIKMKFIFTGGSSEYPFWNLINGPIADAIWHAGQVTTMRRASGNPISPKVQFLEGKIGK